MGDGIYDCVALKIIACSPSTIQYAWYLKKDKMTQFQIIATLGPASSQPEIWEQMLAAGTTSFRLNTSHLSLEQLLQWLERLEAVLHGRGVPVVVDLQGSKWRLGQFEGWEVAEGETVDLVLGPQAGRPGEIPVPHTDFFAAAEGSDGEVVLNDARVRLQIEQMEVGQITARVLQAGPLAANKGITLSRTEYRSEGLSEKDQSIYHQTLGLDWVRYAVSYVKDGQEMQHYRRLLGNRSDLIAKLERQPALMDVNGIEQQAGELWLCRGDLGAEIGLRAMAQAVYDFSQSLSNRLVPAVMAGQVLEHMVSSHLPTRSEVCYLHDARAAGYAGVVLSDETVVGNFPIEACRMAAYVTA
jgi:pyruvate kinase